MSDSMEKQKPPLLVLLGPTAVGKTELSLKLAEKWNCEIISGDSMQVYRGMDIGTAKISLPECAGIKHHLIDILEPDQPFSVSDFQSLAKAAEAEIRSAGKLPFVVGGTGLYIESLCYEYSFSEAGSDEVFRAEQYDYAEAHGSEALHRRLRDVDPEAADRLHPNDIRRIIRALEIFNISGRTLSEQLAAQQRISPYRLCLIGLTMDRSLLYERIEKRVEQMLELGLVGEVQALLEKGYHRGLTAMQGLGYKEIIAYLSGECSYEQAVYTLKRDTRHYAKRQLSWFRRMKQIEWVDVSETGKFSAHFKLINDIIARKIDD